VAFCTLSLNCIHLYNPLLYLSYSGHLFLLYNIVLTSFCKIIIQFKISSYKKLTFRDCIHYSIMKSFDLEKSFLKTNNWKLLIELFVGRDCWMLTFLWELSLFPQKNLLVIKGKKLRVVHFFPFFESIFVKCLIKNLAKRTALLRL
jgi:hypothetical protein